MVTMLKEQDTERYQATIPFGMDTLPMASEYEVIDDIHGQAVDNETFVEEEEEEEEDIEDIEIGDTRKDHEVLIAGTSDVDDFSRNVLARNWTRSFADCCGRGSSGTSH